MPRAPAAPGLTIGSKRRRLGAGLLDLLPAIAMTVPVYAVFGADGGRVFGDAEQPLLPFFDLVDLLTSGTGLLLSTGFMLRGGGRRGQSLGKQVCGLRVVAGDGTPVSTGRIWGRGVLLWLVTPLWMVVFLFNVGWILFDRRNRALHDLAAGTVVVAAHR